MAYYYVICITLKRHHTDPYTAIEAYGLADSPGAATASVRWSQVQMIEVLSGGVHTVRAFGVNPRTGTAEYADLEVATRPDGRRFVKSKNDRERPDILLALRHCTREDVKYSPAYRLKSRA